uniref:Uncharacterized protein n=1 Tax=Cannabis sativa TaxID=3483 RepID=A0A803PTL2_CANSA
MPKRVYRDEADSEEEIIEQESAPKLILNISPWEMDQLINKFRIYNNLRKYKTQWGLESVPELFWNRFSVHGEMPSKCVEGGFVVWSWAHVQMGVYFPLSSTKYTHDFRDYYFYTSGFLLKRIPTLSLDFNPVFITAEHALKAVNANEKWLVDWRRQFSKILNEAKELTIRFKELDPLASNPEAASMALSTEDLTTFVNYSDRGTLAAELLDAEDRDLLMPQILAVEEVDKAKEVALNTKVVEPRTILPVAENLDECTLPNSDVPFVTNFAISEVLPDVQPEGTQLPKDLAHP